MKQTNKIPLAVSPCVNLCRLDPARALCQGCFRSLAEITAWSKASNAERLDILALVAQRRAEAAS